MGDYVEPYVEGVDAIDPPEVEHVGPFVDDADADLPVKVEDPPAVVMFDPVEAESESEPETKSAKKSSKKK